MRLWIDLANSPHVPFFKALVDRFTALGHEIEITARDFAETVPLAQAAGFEANVVGVHGGRAVSAKAGTLMSRAWALAGWARGRHFDLAVSHNSYSQILAARALRIKTITLMDYEYPPTTHHHFKQRVAIHLRIGDDHLVRAGITNHFRQRFEIADDGDIFVRRATG